MSVRHKALLALFGISLLWGTAGVVAKNLLQVADPFVITFYRFGFASLLILPFFLREKRPSGFWKHLIPLSLLNSLNVLFFYIGISTTTANAAFVIGASAPLTTALLSRLLIREHISATKLLGIGIGLTGTLSIILLPALSSGQAFVGDMRGNLIITMGMVSWVLYAIGTRHVVSTGTYSPLMTTSMNLFVTTCMAFFVALFTQKHLFVPALVTMPHLPVLAFASVMLTVTTFFLFQWAIQHLPATTASLKEYLQLVFAIGFNTIILKEQLTPEFLIGSGFVLFGVFVATGQHMSRKLITLLFTRSE